jgi:zinc protease
MEAIDAVVEPIRSEAVSPELLDRLRSKERSRRLRSLAEGTYPRFGIADLLAAFELIDGDAALINGVEDRFRAVTPEILLATAREYLRPTNRNVLALEPGAAS